MVGRKAALFGAAVAAAAAVVADAQALVKYDLLQSECKAGNFTDAVSNLKATINPEDVDCPSVTVGGNTFNNAHNGVQLTGTRHASGGASEGVLTDGPIAAAGAFATNNQFTIEAWILPDFDPATESGQKYVIMEIGDKEHPDAGLNFEWTCDGADASRDYSAQLVYSTEADDTDSFELTYRFGTGNDDCEVIAFAATPLEQGQLYHVAVTMKPSTVDVGNGDEPGYLVELFIDGARIAGRNGPGVVALDAWPATDVLRIGSSPAVFSLGTVNDFTYTWKGRIAGASVHNVALSSAEVTAAFNGYLANSAPVAPENAHQVWGVEDEVAEIDPRPAVYDFDVEQGKDTIRYLFRSVLRDAEGFGGEIAVNGTALNLTESIGFDFTDSNVTYRPTVENAYEDAAIKFDVAGVDGSGAQSPDATVQIAIEMRNDAPVTLGELADKSVAQTSSVRVPFGAEDVDCRVTTTVDGEPTGPNGTWTTGSSCADFGVETTFTIDSADGQMKLGEFYEADCSSGGSCRCNGLPVKSQALTLPFTKTVTGRGKKYLEMCFQGCFTELDADGNDDPDNSRKPCPAGVKQRPDGLLGDETFSYVVRDEAGLESPARNWTVTVKGVLVSAQEPLPQAALDENSADRKKIVLKSVNFRCENKDGTPRESPPDSCKDAESIAKTYVLREVPDPAQGAFYLTQAGGEPLVIPPTDVGGAPGLELESDTIYFEQAEGFHNRESYPICDTSSSATFSQCPNRDNGVEYAINCRAPDNMVDTCKDKPKPTAKYQQFTVVDLKGDVLGGCNVTDANEGCPVNVVYSVKVGSLFSPSEPGVAVWVTNQHTKGHQFVDADKEMVFRDVKKNEAVLIKQDDTYVQIDPMGEMDVRVLELDVTAESNSATLSLRLEDWVPPPSTIYYNAKSSDKADYTLKFFGTVSALNDVLKRIEFRTTNYVKEIVVQYKLQDTRTGFADPNRFESTKTVKFLVVEDVQIVDDGVELLTVGIWSSVAAGSLLILGACYCCIMCLFRRALAGERAAVWFVRNVLFTHIDPHDEHALDRDPGVMDAADSFEAAIKSDRQRMERVRCCAHLLSCLCPCLCKLDPNRNEDLPSEEDMTKAALHKIQDKIAAQHMPPLADMKRSVRLEVAEDEIFDWEVHETIDERTGEPRKFYYNPKTDVSSWEKPTVKVRATGTAQRSKLRGANNNNNKKKGGQSRRRDSPSI